MINETEKLIIRLSLNHNSQMKTFFYSDLLILQQSNIYLSQ